MIGGVRGRWVVGVVAALVVLAPVSGCSQSGGVVSFDEAVAQYFVMDGVFESLVEHVDAQEGPRLVLLDGGSPLSECGAGLFPESDEFRSGHRVYLVGVDEMMPGEAIDAVAELLGGGWVYDTETPFRDNGQLIFGEVTIGNDAITTDPGRTVNVAVDVIADGRMRWVIVDWFTGCYENVPAVWEKHIALNPESRYRYTIPLREELVDAIPGNPGNPVRDVVGVPWNGGEGEDTGGA